MTSIDYFKKILILFLCNSGLMGMIFGVVDSAVAQGCTNTPLPRLMVGNQAQVIVQGEGEDGRLRVRENPGLDHIMVAEMVTDEVFSVIDGPECVDGYYWWQVTTRLGMVGWSAESVAGTYFVAPLNDPNPDPLPSAADFEIARFSETMEYLNTLPTSSLTHLIWTPDSQTLLRLDAGDCAPVIRDAQTDELILELDPGICAHYIMWRSTESATSLLIYDKLADAMTAYTLSDDPLAVELTAQLATIPLLSERYPLLRWTENGDVYLMLGTGLADSIWYQWPAAQWSETETLEPTIQEVHLPFEATLSQDNTHWVSTVNETDVEIVPIENVNAQRLFAGHGAAITSRSISPDGTKLATAAGDNSIFIWDVETQERLLEIHMGNFSVGGLRWNHQGTLIASTAYNPPSRIRIWDAQTGQLLLTLRATRMSVNKLLWSPDDSQIMTYTNNLSDHAIIVWELGELR